MRKIDPVVAFIFGFIAGVLFLSWIATAEANTMVRVDLYQVTPEGLAMLLGTREIPIKPDVAAAIPGIREMHCQLYVRDYNLNGIPEAPAMLSCLDAEGGQHNIPVETEGMERVHLET